MNKHTYAQAHTHTHLCDLEDRDWLLGALAMCQQQVQLSVSIQICHSATCPKHSALTPTTETTIK